jgi:hypothetical protein
MTRSRIILPVLLLAAVLLADGRAAELQLLSYEDARTMLRGVSDSLKAAAAGAAAMDHGCAHHSVARSICGAVVGAGPRLAHRRVRGEGSLSTLGPNLIRIPQRTRNA